MTIQDLILISIVVALIILIVQHCNISRLANQAAASHCKKYGVLLLDQSIVLRSIRLHFSSKAGLRLKRSYGFEFSTTGDLRYNGSVSFDGRSFLELGKL